VTKRVQSLGVVCVGTVPELDMDKVPLPWSGTGVDLNSGGGSVIGQTLELGAARGENGVLGGVSSDYGADQETAGTASLPGTYRCQFCLCWSQPNHGPG